MTCTLWLIISYSRKDLEHHNDYNDWVFHFPKVRGPVMIITVSVLYLAGFRAMGLAKVLKRHDQLRHTRANSFAA